MIKIGIDPSGTGTTGIVIYEDNKLMEKIEFTNKDWKKHYEFIQISVYEASYKYTSFFIPSKERSFINIEDCLYTSANASKDRDYLLKLTGAIEMHLARIYDAVKPHEFITIISPKFTKSIVKNIENLSKYNDSCIWKYEKDNNLTYQYGKGWKYNNEKISNHIRDAIIIANYKG